MAVRFNRVLLAFSLPAIFAIISFYWFRRRKRSPLAPAILPSSSLDSCPDKQQTPCADPQLHEDQKNMQLYGGDPRDNDTSRRSGPMAADHSDHDDEEEEEVHVESPICLGAKRRTSSLGEQLEGKTVDVDTSPLAEAVAAQVVCEPKTPKGSVATDEGVEDTVVETPVHAQCGEEHVSNFSDFHSEGSCDSGKGGSDIQGTAGSLATTTSSSSPETNNNHIVSEDSAIIYQFELPYHECGRLIGRNGHYVQLIHESSNARVIVNKHPVSQFVKICTIEGKRSEIRSALKCIRQRFPARDYPEITLQQINVINPASCPLPVPQNFQLNLPQGVSCDVILSSMVNAGHLFLQQPTHPTYPSLSRLDQFMTATYSSTDTPRLPRADPGVICAVPMMGGWFRGMIVSVDCREADLKFVDYGGYSKIPISSLRQIRYDFMSLPFQASECYLANIQPIDGASWTAEASTLFEELAQGQILQANTVCVAEDGVPYVNLHKIQGAESTFINAELVAGGHAKWIEAPTATV